MEAMDIEQARFNMIEQQIRPWDVLNDQVLKTIAGTPRENFVPPKYKSLAFSDSSIPLNNHQAMMPPKLEAKLLQALDLKPTDSVLEVGTGSGYLTACLAQLGQSVVSLECYEDFQKEAQPKLDALGITNTRLIHADAATGYDTDRKFDAIAVTGSLPEIHQGFHTLLAPAGRLFVIVGKPPIMQALLITRVSEQEWHQESLFETSVPPLVNVSEPEAFSF